MRGDDFTFRRATQSKFSSGELKYMKKNFAASFWSKYHCTAPENILNVDETGVYYDSPPRCTWSHRDDTAAIKEAEKHSERITAVLTVRMDGTKLPIIFIVRGEDGGRIDGAELETYPPGHL
ncbi:hypothetical protein ACHHYP_20495 [Achlya hypogyna]|uniref:DDE-1 domain-containing protein n=1 Tax=Achlya hypogyna TaxID=1202772 RepID=A0A1V9YKR7_ACHHY|nr:hypothetical protein ACHHYP_20495 [Achlya hypogyna]